MCKLTKIFFIVFLLASGSEVYSQPVTWQREYPRPFNVYGTCVTQTFDGGFVMCGETNSQPRSIFILRTNYLGDTLWSKLIYGIEPLKVIQCNDSNFLIAGSADGINTVSSFILKVGRNGDSLWSKIFELNIQSGISDVIETNNRDFLIFGSSTISLFPQVISKFFLLKCNSIGDSLWIKYYDNTGGSGIMSNYDVNRILLTGARLYSSRAVITDTYGNQILLSNTSLREGVSDSIEKRFYFISDTITSTFRALNFLKTDTSFNKILSRVVTISMRNLHSFHLLKNTQGVVVCGYSSNTKSENPVAFLLQLSNEGNVLWYKDFPLQNHFLYFDYASMCFDKGFITVGSNSPIIEGGISNLLATKTDSLGNTIPLSIVNYSNNFPQEYVLYQNYPNPFNSQTKIKFDIKRDSKIKIVIYNILGQEIKTLFNENLRSGGYSFSYKTSPELSSGFYFYTMQINNRFDNLVITKKLLLIK